MTQASNKLSQFWQELKRRKVLYFLIGYLAACLAIIEFFGITSDKFTLPENTFNLLYILSAIGIPVVILLPWYINRRKPEAISDELEAKEPNSKSDKHATSEKTIIVLPFENMSSDPDQEYFSDGITEEIITDLSHIHDLKVISRSSAMTFKGKSCTIKEIAEKVNVQYVLEGSVRKAGTSLRITAQLIDGLSDMHLWADKYSGTLDDIFDIQEKVSKSIVDALKIKLSSDEEAIIGKQKINDATAYEQYLLARHEIWRSTKESLSRAIQLLNSSIDSIGRNEYLLAALGYVYFQYVNLGIYPDDKYLDMAEELINEALTLNPELSKAYSIKSMIHETRGELIDSFEAIKQALKFDPADSEALMMMAFMYALVGRPEEGKPYARLAIESDPLNPIVYFGEWWVYQSDGKFDKSLETCSKMYNLDKDNPVSVFAYANALAYNNNVKEATKLFDSMQVSHPDLPHTLLGKAIRHAINNEKQEALKSITEQVGKAAEMDHIFAWFLAGVNSLIGEKEKAIDYLERATRDVFIDYPFFALHDPFLENIRKEERFMNLMEEVKAKWENFEV